MEPAPVQGKYDQAEIGEFRVSPLLFLSIKCILNGPSSCLLQHRTIDWCACSPVAIQQDEFEHMLAVIRRSPNIFFARKFDPSIDIFPINGLEESLGVLDRFTPGLQ